MTTKENREVTFIIDTKRGFEKMGYKDSSPFRVIYTLKKNETGIYYELTDFENNPININSLNGYQRMYTNECFSMFMRNNYNIPDDYKDFIEVKNNYKKEINKNEELSEMGNEL